MGVVHLLPVALLLLSSAGPAPLPLSAQAMSAFYYGHFIALTVGGFIGLAARAAADRVFYGGPFVDFAVAVTLFMLAASVRPWLAAVSLVAVGLRMMNGAPFFAPPPPTDS